MQTTGTTGHGDAPRATPPDRPHLVSLRTVLAFQTTRGRLRLVLAVARAWRGIPDRAADPAAAAAEQDARDAPIRPGTRYRRLRRRPAPDLLPFPTRLMPPAAWDQEIGDTARARPTGALQCSLRLATGQYRSAAVGTGYHDSSQGAGSSWSVQLMAAPEPESLLLLATVVGVGLVGLVAGSGGTGSQAPLIGAAMPLFGQRLRSRRQQPRRSFRQTLRAVSPGVQRLPASPSAALRRPCLRGRSPSTARIVGLAGRARRQQVRPEAPPARQSGLVRQADEIVASLARSLRVVR